MLICARSNLCERILIRHTNEGHLALPVIHTMFSTLRNGDANFTNDYACCLSFLAIAFCDPNREDLEVTDPYSKELLTPDDLMRKSFSVGRPLPKARAIMRLYLYLKRRGTPMMIKIPFDHVFSVVDAFFLGADMLVCARP